jgi:hypothetical protein
VSYSAIVFVHRGVGATQTAPAQIVDLSASTQASPSHSPVVSYLTFPASPAVADPPQSTQPVQGRCHLKTGQQVSQDR